MPGCERVKRVQYGIPSTNKSPLKKKNTQMLHLLGPRKCRICHRNIITAADWQFIMTSRDIQFFTEQGWSQIRIILCLCMCNLRICI